MGSSKADSPVPGTRGEELCLSIGPGLPEEGTTELGLGGEPVNPGRWGEAQSRPRVEQGVSSAHGRAAWPGALGSGLRSEHAVKVCKDRSGRS